jgi:hypothetical protein
VTGFPEFPNRGHASFFPMLFDWSTYIFSMLLEHILYLFFSFLFSMALFPFARIQEEKSLWTFGVFIFGGWMACFA